MREQARCRVDELRLVIEQASVSAPTFAIVDAARLDGLVDYLAAEGFAAISLFSGALSEELRDVAPYLVIVPRDMLQRLLAFAWGRGGMVLLLADAAAADIRRHLRALLMVRNDDEEEMYFRFYDPRVLRAYLPTCTIDERREFFGPVQTYLVEDEDADRAVIFDVAGHRA